MDKKLLEKKKVVKSFSFETKSVDETQHIIEGVFSTSDIDRQEEIVDQNGWDIKNYLMNPVVLWGHDASQFPIAQMIDIRVDEQNRLVGKMKFAVEEYDKAATVYNLMVGKYLRAFSVGFSNNKYEVIKNNETVILRENELYEVSVVNVPANARALAISKGIDMSALDIEEKSVVPYADHGMAPEDETWDGPAQMSGCGDDMGKLKSICAWYDSDNPDAKSSYKLPHHQADGLKAVWKGVNSAMGALLGARGGVNIPDSEKQGVYNHLAKHYKQFGKDAPEMKSYTEEELKELDEQKEVIKILNSIEALKNANKETLRTAISVLTDALNAVAKTDNQVSTKKVEHPSHEGSIKTIPVKLLNRAIKELLKIKKNQ